MDQLIYQWQWGRHEQFIKGIVWLKQDQIIPHHMSPKRDYGDILLPGEQL